MNILHRSRNLAALAAILALAAATGADEPKAVGRAVSGDASLLRREEFGKPWYPIKKGEALPAEQLILGLPRAALESKNGAVKLVYWADWHAAAPYPVIDTAVVLHNTVDFDMDLMLDRGWIGLINQKKDGSARVRVRTYGGGEWELTLEEPGSAITLMVHGGWPRGVPFKAEPGPTDVPTYAVVLLALDGSTRVKYKRDEALLKAPPGPAKLVWDSVTGQDSVPTRLEKLPLWASPAATDADVEARIEMQDRFRKLVMEKGVDAALGELVSSDKPAERRLGVLGLMATDDLLRLGDALRQTRYPDVWDTAVMALRHWIGRAPGNDQKLYQGMLARKKWNRVEAETALQLLHTFSEDEVQSPELYETLIDFLDHDNLGIRGLAHWHLYRLVPAGGSIDHHPTDPKGKREAAKKAWQKLIPRGQMPPRARPMSTKNDG